MLCTASKVTSLMHCCSEQGALLANWEAKMLVYKMSEGRRAHVILPDERRLEIQIQPKLYAKELLDIVASHFGLKEKDYFGLSFLDESGHFQWLQLDRKVLEHDFTKKSGIIELHFAIRFFIEKTAYLQDAVTVELFFQNAVRAIYNGELDCDVDTVFLLAAWALQALYGDYADPVTAQERLKKVAVIPARVLQKHSLVYCEENITDIYRGLHGHRRGQAVLTYMSIIESIPSYGIHFYEVKDKSGALWLLGLSFKGISVYEHSDLLTPCKVFSWKHLENLYFRDRKFSIEVHDPKRVTHTLSNFNLYEEAVLEPYEAYDDLSNAICEPTTQVSVSRRTFGPGNVTVHTWFASTPQLTKCIWSMAVSQHQFYLDRKQSRSQLQHSRSLTDVAALLNQQNNSSPSLHFQRIAHANDTTAGGNHSDSSLYATAVPGALLSTSASGDYARREITAEDIEESRVAKREMYSALKARKEVLEAALRKKMEELKLVCIAEAQITGIMPKETPVSPGESLPAVPRKVGTEFILSPRIVNSRSSKGEDMLAELELECELQRNIAKAALKLANDRTAPTNITKQRKLFHKKSISKLRETEKRLESARRSISKAHYRSQNSLDELSDDSQKFVESEIESRASPIPYHEYTGSLPHPGKSQQFSLSNQVDGGTVIQRQNSASRPTTPGPTGGAPLLLRPKSPGVGTARSVQQGSNTTAGVTEKQLAAGYVPSSVYTTRNSYRDKMYPTHAGGMHHSHSTSNTAAYLQQTQNGSRASGKSASITTADSGMYRTSRVDSSGSSSLSQYANEMELKTGSLGTRQHRTPTHQTQQQTSQDDRYYGSLERSSLKSVSREMSASPALVSDLVPSKFGSKRESISDKADSNAHSTQQMIVDSISRYNAVESGQLPPDCDHYHHHHPHYYHHMQVPSQQQLAHHHHHHHFHSGHMQPVMNGFDSSTKSAFVPVPVSGPVVPQSADAKIVRQNSQTQKQQTDAFKKSADNLLSSTHYQRQSSNNSAKSVASPQSSNVMHMLNFTEVSKPFEMADVYKYSEQRRRQKQGAPKQTLQQQNIPTVQYPHANWVSHSSQNDASIVAAGVVGNSQVKTSQSLRNPSNAQVSSRIHTSYSTHDAMATNGPVMMNDVVRTGRTGAVEQDVIGQENNAHQRGSKSAPQTPQMIHRMV